MPRPSNDRKARAERLNFAVGLFDDVERVEAVVGELHGRHVPSSRYRFVVALGSPFFSQQKRLLLVCGLAVERIALERLDPEHAWSEIVFAGNLAMAQRSLCAHAAAAAPPALLRQNLRLVQHLESGGGVLVVGTDDQAEQQAIARVLLRLASQVFTHQMRALRYGPGVQARCSATAMETSITPSRVVTREGRDGRCEA